MLPDPMAIAVLALALVRSRSPVVASTVAATLAALDVIAVAIWLGGFRRP